MTTRRPGSGLEAPESGAASEEERDSVATISQEVEDLWPSVCPGCLPRTCLLRGPTVTSCKESPRCGSLLVPGRSLNSVTTVVGVDLGWAGHGDGVQGGGVHRGGDPRHVQGWGRQTTKLSSLLLQLLESSLITKYEGKRR